MGRIFILFFIGLSLTSTAQAEDLMPGEVYLLIKNARPNVQEPDGWATDLLEVFKAHAFPASKENICAAIAVIDQESNFKANPSVPGLGKLAEKSLRDKFNRIPLLGRVGINYLDSHPIGQISYLQRIRTAKNERDLDLTYRAFVEDFGRASSMSLIVQSGLVNSMIEERNNISTIGSMQVSVKFALDEAKSHRYIPMTLSDDYAVRDELYTRRGGMYYGAKQLLGYNTGYDRKIFRFADFNAGRYSSRNAAFQQTIGAIAKQKLATDGDLLGYAKNGSANSAVSNSEKLIRQLASKYKLGLSNADIRKDLLKEKTDEFALSATYLAIKNTYLKNTGKPAPFAQLPGIDLSSPKLSHKMTTGSYAASVDRRYNKCMAVK